MKGIILAGGRGSRLMPLTADKPKPMMELLGKPVICHLLDLIAKTCIKDVYITLGYKGEQISDYLGNTYGNIRLYYSREEKPLGTAGSVKRLSSIIDDTILVVSGDIYTDVDLTSMINFHNKIGAQATVLATKVDNPKDFGVIVRDSSSRIVFFEEKPNNPSSNLVNAGVYVLDKSVLSHIPDGFSDFSRDVFPYLDKLYCYEDSFNWSDIGTLSSYYSVNLKMAKKYEEESKLHCVLQKATK